MTHQLIPPPDLAPPSVKHLPLAKRIELWANLVDSCDATRSCLPGWPAELAQKAIYKQLTVTGAPDAWKTTSERKFNSWKTCLAGRRLVAAETALAALDDIWDVLAPLGHPMAVMGGISLAAWHHIRATRDVDLLIALDRSSVDAVLRVLTNCCIPQLTNSTTCKSTCSLPRASCKNRLSPAECGRMCLGSSVPWTCCTAMI
jgi:hypothetical protein